MKKNRKSLFRRISNWLHLWLGLLSGIVVFVVCLTAAIWVFRDETNEMFSPGQRVKVQETGYLKPSELIKASLDHIQREAKDTLAVIYKVDYREAGKSAVVGYFDHVDGAYMELYINPYSAEVLYNRTELTGMRKFNDFLRSGHRFFWLPRPFGSYFVGSCSLIFLVTLITGLIWWFPAKWNKSTRNKSFKIKWGASWKRLNIDLHNVLGFYAILFTIILTVTGVVFTFRWFDNGYRWMLTGDQPNVEHTTKAMSDTTLISAKFLKPDDELFKRYKIETKLRIMYPQSLKDLYTVFLNPTSGHNDVTTRYGFDQKTLKQVDRSRPREELSVGEWIYKANFDIHVGTIGGMTTKIIACIASLIGASLPVTGFIIWYNRKWGRKKRKVVKTNKHD